MTKFVSLEIEVLSGLGGKDPAAILIKTETHHILLDAGGVLEDGAKLWKVPERIDAVLLTHDHYDHIGNVHNLPIDVPIYCSSITARSLPSDLNIYKIPVKGQFKIGDTTITTGANGHAYGGIWFHLDCGGGIFYSGDVSLESLLYHFDSPPRAEIALLDASYGLYDIPQTQLRNQLKDALTRPALMPVPPSGRAVEMAVWLAECGFYSLALDEECLGFLKQMIVLNDGSLHQGIEKKLRVLLPKLQTIPEITHLVTSSQHVELFRLPKYLLAGDPDGRKGTTGALRSVDGFSYHVIFTGYCDALARAQIEREEVAFLRWNVHPTKQGLLTLIDLLGCKMVMPLFVGVKNLDAWEEALGVALILTKKIGVKREGRCAVINNRGGL